eukprot:7613099-Pyramimonas_sp.AAC.1
MSPRHTVSAKTEPTGLECPLLHPGVTVGRAAPSRGQSLRSSIVVVVFVFVVVVVVAEHYYF